MARAERLEMDTSMPLPDISPQQREILSLLCRGLSHRQVAGALGIKRGTLIRHLDRIAEKFAVPRYQIVGYALQNGFVPTES